MAGGKRGRPRKVGDVGLGIELSKMRAKRAREAARYKENLARTDAKIHEKVREYRDSGAGLSAIAEAYGTSDRWTIIAILGGEVPSEKASKYRLVMKDKTQSDE